MAVALLPVQRWRLRKPTFAQSIIDWENPITRGLLGRWVFNEAGSRRLFDLVNNQRPMDFIGSTIAWSGYSKFESGAAVNVGGVTQYITGSGNSPLNGLSAFTAAGWIRGVLSDSHSFFSLWDGTANQVLIRQTGAGGPWSFFTHTTAQVGGVFTGAPSANDWAFSVFRYDGAEMSVWLNGIKDATTFVQTGALQSNTVNPLKMTGNEGAFSSERWHFGGIDNVSLYGRALSVGEIQQIYREPFCDIAVERNRFYSFATGGGGGVPLLMGQACL